MCNTTTDRAHADVKLEKYVTNTVMAIIKGFFSSPFSVNHSNLQVTCLISTKLMRRFAFLCEEYFPPCCLSTSSTQRNGNACIMFLFPQTNQSVFVKLLQSAYRVYNCAWLDTTQKANTESCIKTLADVGES